MYVCRVIVSGVWDVCHSLEILLRGLFTCWGDMIWYAYRRGGV